jgi:hypothetical protein
MFENSFKNYGTFLGILVSNIMRVKTLGKEASEMELEKVHRLVKRVRKVIMRKKGNFKKRKK